MFIYSIAVYRAIPSFMGWPVEGKIKEESIVLNIRIKEPDPIKKYSGNIFLWVDSNIEKNSFQLIDFIVNPLSYTSETDPKAYKLPYSKELHKKISKMMKQKKGNPNSVLTVKGVLVKAQRKRGTANINDDQLKFKILNPRELLRKD